MTELGRTESKPIHGSTRRLTWRIAWRYVEHVFALVGVLFVLFHFTLRSSIIVSPSMAPTLQGKSWTDGDQVLTELLSYRLRLPQRWEVVTFRRPDGTSVMKRVVGLPGERIQLRKSGELVVNGKPVPQPESLKHVRYIPIGLISDDRAVECQAGYFVLGDDSKDSDDSRYDGPIPAGWIIGRAWLIVRPWPRFGRVNRV